MGPCGAKLSENVKSWLAKGFAVAYGLLSFGVVFLVKYLPGVLQVKLIKQRCYFIFVLQISYPRPMVKV